MKNYKLIICLGFLLLCFNTVLFSQNDSIQQNNKPIEIDFLFSYYQQDGDSAAVTGGRGTEELTNVAPYINIYIPGENRLDVATSWGVDIYSSASSDNINNPYLQADHISSASARDARVYGNLSFLIKDKNYRNTWSYDLGMSFEWDVTSFNTGAGFKWVSKDKNKDFGIKTKLFVDKWQLIYPVELRGIGADDKLLERDIRYTWSLNTYYAFVINKKLQASVAFEPVLQMGLLSTPFHRVYFDEDSINHFALDNLNAFDPNLDPVINFDIERLPNQRMKFPLGFRLNYAPTNFMIIRSFNRVYYDTWNVFGYTAELEMPFKIGNAVRLYPSYRFGFQTEADYFSPYLQNNSWDAFYTSDNDLARFTSHKVGFGLGVYPVYGIFRFKSEKRLSMLKGLDFKYAYYTRSNGLNAHIGSVGLSFAINRLE